MRTRYIAPICSLDLALSARAHHIDRANCSPRVGTMFPCHFWRLKYYRTLFYLAVRWLSLHRHYFQLCPSALLGELPKTFVSSAAVARTHGDRVCSFSGQTRTFSASIGAEIIHDYGYSNDRHSENRCGRNQRTSCRSGPNGILGPGCGHAGRSACRRNEVAGRVAEQFAVRGEPDRSHVRSSGMLSHA